mmetsp:Transcript_27840/g.67105  ORF Transcript_27840/g.67105 Transcript_27840/m.67105 type:complete len:376 (-) Transcript_27840:123-1250(-)
MESSIEVVPQRHRYRLDRARVVPGKYPQIVRGLVPHRIGMVRNVDFHVYRRSRIGRIAKLPFRHDRTVPRLRVVLAGGLDEVGIGGKALFGFEVFDTVRTRRQLHGGGSAISILLLCRGPRRVHPLARVPLHHGRPEHVILPRLEVPLEVVVVVPQPDGNDPRRAALLQGGIGEPSHVVVVLVLLVPQSEDGVVHVFEEGGVSQCGDRGGCRRVAASLADGLLRLLQFVYIANSRLALHHLDELLGVVRRLPLAVRRQQQHRLAPTLPSSSSFCPIIGVPVPGIRDGRPYHRRVVVETPFFVGAKKSFFLGGIRYGAGVVVVDDVLEVDDAGLEAAGFGFGGYLPREHLGRAGLGSVVDGQVSAGVFRSIQLLDR